MKRVIRHFVQHGLTVNLLSLLLLAGGIYVAFHIQREAFPSVNFDVVVIQASYPGSSPKEVESLLVNPIEQELKELDGIKKIRSTAFPGMMQITIELDPNVRERQRVISDIQRAIDNADLPRDLPDKPRMTEVKSEQAPVISFTIFGPFTDLELKGLADRIKDDVLALPGVARVLVQGDRKRELRITLDDQRMRDKRISIDDVIQTVRSWNVDAPAGKVLIEDGQRVIRIAGEFRSPEDAERLVLRANEVGNAIYLSDIATIEETLEPLRRFIGSQGMPAVNMIVLKKREADIIALADSVRAYLKSVPELYGHNVQVHTYQDFSRITRLRLGVLTSNGAIGLLLVLCILLLFMRPAVALTTAWGLPIIFFSGLLVLYLSGVTLNLLTMFGFIIVLGLMVDDAIIIGENITYHMERGLPPTEAAVAGTMELLGPVTTTVITTIIAFLPLMFMQGIIGKFVYSIPVVVVVLLIFSWLEALFILPNHIRDLARSYKPAKETRVFRWLSRIYGITVSYAVRWRYFTLLATLATLVASLALTGKMKFQLFPPGAEDQFYIRVTLPPGTALEETRNTLLAIDREVRKRIPPEWMETTTFVAGESSADQREALKQIGDRFGFVRVVLTPFTERKTSAYAIMERLQREIPPNFPDAELSFAMMRPGPPVGRALQVELSGSDLDAQHRAARRLMQWLATIDGVHAIESDLQPGDPEIHVHVDRALAAYAGVDLATIATHIRAAFDGIRVSTLHRGGEEADVTIRYPESAHRSLSTLLHLPIPNRKGGLIPLSKVAHLKEEPGTTVIRHVDGTRVTHVSAEVDRKKITSKELNALVLARKSDWLGPDAGRVDVHLGGEEERSKESVRALLHSFIFALLGIFAVLAIQFNRITYPFLVMLAIPFGAIGIIVGFYLHHQPISFMALMGFVALSGVVVNSSLVMAVIIQRLLKKGIPWMQAIVQGSIRRLRAITLTALTTVVGLLPTAYGWGGFDPFVAPMALALSWGLVFSTFITLYSVPAALAVGLDVGRLSRRCASRLMKKRS